MSNDQSTENINKTLIRPTVLQALINHAEHGITIAIREGDDTTLLYVNKAFEEMTGYSSEECLYKDCRFLQGNEQGQAGVKNIRHAIQHEEQVNTTIKNYRKNGEMFWNDITITPYFDEVEGTMYFIGIQKDVTDLVNLKAELATTKDKIKHVV